MNAATAVRAETMLATGNQELADEAFFAGARRLHGETRTAMNGRGTAIALVLIALPSAAVQAQLVFNPDKPLTPAQWMR